MKRLAIAAMAALLLAGCGRKDEDKPTPAPEPTYASPKEADAAIPPELKAEHQHMLECEAKAMRAAGREPEISTEMVARITREVKAGRRAAPDC